MITQFSYNDWKRYPGFNKFDDGNAPYIIHTNGCDVICAQGITKLNYKVILVCFNRGNKIYTRTFKGLDIAMSILAYIDDKCTLNNEISEYDLELIIDTYGFQS